MRRIRNLAVFGVIALVLILGLGYTFRGALLPVLGVNLDSGPVAGRSWSCRMATPQPSSPKG